MGNNTFWAHALASMTLSFFCFEFAAAQSAVSLNYSIQTAFQKNENTQSNTSRLQAMVQKIESSKKERFLPSFTASQSFGGSRYSDELSAGDSRMRSRTTPLSVTINIFRGFADVYQLDLQRCLYRQQEAIYNSTDALIKNTKSQIAGLVVTSYVEVAGNRQNFTFATENIKLMERLAPLAKTEIEKARIQNAIATLQIALEDYRAAQAIAENDYRFVVNEPAPEMLQSLEETISSIVIPATPAEALSYAAEKSPDIISARLGLECQEKSLKALKAENKGIRIDANGSMSRQQTMRPGQIDTIENSASARITISKTFGFGTKESENSEELLIESARRRLTSNTQEVEKNVQNSYINYTNGMKSFESYTNNFLRAREQILTLVAEFERTGHGDLQGILNLIGNYYGYWDNRDFKMRELITLKFSIQRSIGTLFGNISQSQINAGISPAVR